MGKLKVMHLTNNIAKESAVEGLILMLAERLDKSRFDISVVSLTEPELVSASFLENAGRLASHVNHISWSGFSSFFTSVIKLSRIIKEYDIDILHTHDLRTNFVGFAASRLAGVPVVASAHGWVLDTVPMKLKLLQMIDRWAVRFFTHIVVGSDFLRGDIIKLKIPPENVTTIHNAIDIEKIDVSSDSKSFRKKFGIGSQDLVVGMLGRLSKEKGHKFLLEAAKCVIENISGVKFLIVGDGAIKNELEDLASELGLSDYVVFTGFYGNLSEALSSIDLFVQSSLTESLPLVVLEAMVAGKPVIGTNVGGLPEVIEHKKTGLLVEAGNAQELADSIIFMLNNRELMDDMGKASMKLVRERFSIQDFVKKTQDLYDRLVC